MPPAPSSLQPFPRPNVTQLTAILLMGVAGCGKTTVGRTVASKLGWIFHDADQFHPPGNIRKMSAGIPLAESDREPWLAAVAEAMAQCRRSGTPAVFACSALRRRYRDKLLGIPHASDVALIYLQGDRPLIASRLQNRTGHFMPATLLDSQFHTLEEPGLDEDPIVIDITSPLPGVVSEITNRLQARGFPAA